MVLRNGVIKKDKRVAIAMSGGVDSSVAAALLLEEGYEVIGLTMDICTGSAVAEAAKAAANLGIRHEVVNLQGFFKEKVIDYFMSEYLRGRTPNPCAVCNRHLKFGALLEKASELGADMLATGHYARVKYDEVSGRYLLYRAQDKAKDQSYFLYTMTQAQLERIVFPLGEYTKTQVRQKAAELGLVSADKPESQEICFIPDNDYKKFLAAHLSGQGIKPGLFLNTKGEALGRHQGIPYYTVGQRKGLGIALGYPAYVVALDVENNSVILGYDKDIYKKALVAEYNNFIAFAGLNAPLEVVAKIRYGAKPALAVITPERAGRVRVDFDEPQRAITPGQVVTYYQGDLVIGGGLIAAVCF